tara:strand:- start:638 stop:1324 length:687 start_codon:yes stop_codon:yes gene_type:complete
MKKFIKVFLLFILLITIFNKKIIVFYYVNKFSKWVERPVEIENVNFKYSGSVEIEKIKIENLDKLYQKNIFEAEKIILEIDVNTLLSNLIVVKKLDIINPDFFLDIRLTKDKKNLNNKEKDTMSSYEDNIGLAKKINEETSDKIWPKKKRDINFIILESNLIGAKTNINVSSISQSTETKLSEMKFKNFGNEKGYQHYKDVLKFILFDTYASTKNLEIKKILKNVYRR